MLLKIYTNQNSIKLIPEIEDAEIHNGEWRFESRKQLQDCITYGPGVFNATGTTPPEMECYDKSCFTSPGGDCAQDDDLFLKQSVVKLVDYKRAGQWHRVAVVQYAYLCNDDGKTIAKIGA